MVTSTDILTLTNTQAKDLAGRFVTIGSETYCFKNYDRDHPGQPPWRSGAEGKAYPLVGHNQSVAAYLKFFTRPTQKRLERTAWLIDQQIHTWLPGLAAAPLVWVDTRQAHRQKVSTLDFAGYLARAVPGETWLELKSAIHASAVSFPEELRWRCVGDLLAVLSVLEQEDIVHGDLSPNNIVIDLAALPEQPALHLIDFDAFVSPAAGENRAVAVAEGGTFGTEGYCPPDLAAAAAEGDGAASPYSDRYGRDMLLLELLNMDGGLSPDASPSSWDRQQLERRAAAWQARSDPGRLSALAHLDPATVFSLAEAQRPASTELAARLGLRLPTPRLPRHAAQEWRSTPVVLAELMPVAEGERRGPPVIAASGRAGPATMHFLVPWRWSRPSASPGSTTFWQDLRVALGCAAVLLLPGIVALLILLGKWVCDLFGVP